MSADSNSECYRCQANLDSSLLKDSALFMGPTVFPEAEFLDEIQTKLLRVFLHAIHSYLYSFALTFYFFKLTQPFTVFWSSVTVHRKGERRKTWKKTIPPTLWFKKSIQKPQVWELLRLCPETETSTKLVRSWIRLLVSSPYFQTPPHILNHPLTTIRRCKTAMVCLASWTPTQAILFLSFYIRLLMHNAHTEMYICK
jgi:hypothetical protein